MTVISIFKAYKALKEKSTRRVIGNIMIVPVYLVLLAIVLAGYQLIFVGSNELDKNQEYIKENIEKTKMAYGININEQNIEYTGTITETNSSILSILPEKRDYKPIFNTFRKKHVNTKECSAIFNHIFSVRLIPNFA